MNRPFLNRFLQTLLALAATGAVTLLLKRAAPGLNVTTVGFAYLLVVLAVASGFGFYEAFAASLAATTQYNFFFLPPLGSFTISDPQNWVALTAFLITATVASQLSAVARRRAREADARQLETVRLYELSRAILLAEPGDPALGLEQSLVRIFGFRDARVLQADQPLPAAGPYNMSWTLRVGQHPVGTLYADGGPLGPETAEAIAGMVAVAVERAHLLETAGHMQALRESEALKSALLDSVTHDLRTPLTSIKAAASSLLGLAETAPDARRELLTVINEEADRLNDLLEHILEMARIEAGDLRASPRLQPLAPLVEDALARLHLPSQRVQVALPAGLPRVLADGMMIGSVLEQLLANAAAYSPPASPILVSARSEPGEVIVEVRDQGAGIAADVQPCIFDKFFRGPNARQLRPHGLGMGLTIARALVAAHHGRMGVESQPGAGSLFWFSLPAEDGQHDGHGKLHLGD